MDNPAGCPHAHPQAAGCPQAPQGPTTTEQNKQDKDQKPPHRAAASDLQPLPTSEHANPLKPPLSLQSPSRNPAPAPNRSRSRNHRSRSPKYATGRRLRVSVPLRAAIRAGIRPHLLVALGSVLRQRHGVRARPRGEALAAQRHRRRHWRRAHGARARAETAGRGRRGRRLFTARDTAGPGAESHAAVPMYGHHRRASRRPRRDVDTRRGVRAHTARTGQGLRERAAAHDQRPGAPDRHGAPRQRPGHEEALQAFHFGHTHREPSPIIFPSRRQSSSIAAIVA